MSIWNVMVCFLNQKAYLITLLFLLGNTAAYTQNINTDSIKAEQKRKQDSIKAIQNERLDSLNFIRNYRQSKHYKDSVETARLKRLAEMKEEQKRKADSLTQYRKHVADSIMAVRRRYSDSIRHYNDSVRLAQQQRNAELKAERQRINDSMAAVRAYRESKAYKDSITLARQAHRDSIAAIRKHINDSTKAAQIAIRDSMVAARKAYNDSMKSALEAERAIRRQELDSIAAVRKVRADSLAQVREERAALRKKKQEEREKEREDKKKLSLELKIKKKQDAYTNEKMRKKKWTVPRQVVQNTFTRYNYYFNADRKMDEAIDNMVRSNMDNLDSLLPLFPFDPDRDSAKLGSDMDTIIRKASVGIQIHDPRAKWQDDLYLLVGQAYFYKGDYQNAGAAFKHIVVQAEADRKEKEKNKKKGQSSKNNKNEKIEAYSEAEKTGVGGLLEHKPAKNEAMLWLSRTLVQDKKEGQAQTIIDMLRNDDKFPKRLNGRLALEQAFIDLKRGDEKKAVDALALVTGDKTLPDWLRLRANYLNGQLLQKNLQYNESDKYFRQVIGLNPDLEMDFYARKNLAYNSINSSGNPVNTADMLEKMTGDAKYRPYFDQIYYALGKLAIKENNTDKATEHFLKSVALSQSNRKQKGLSYAALGDGYYTLSDYEKAKRYYDSASSMLTPEQDPVFSIAKQRAVSLDRIAGPATLVKEQDSLLHLASLSEKEQKAFIRDYLRRLERLMRDSAYMASNTGNTMNQNQSRDGKGWYFSNPNLMKQGENEFKQKWGNRPLKDNWRRSSSSGGTDMSADNDDHQQNDGPVLPDPDTLFAAIPRSTEELEHVKNTLMEALFNLGKAYYSQLEDYQQALATFDTLEKKFPRNKFMDEVLYTKYLIYLRQHRENEAAGFNRLLQDNYPDSEWAKLLRGASGQQTEDNTFFNEEPHKPGASLSNHYDETYKLLMQRQYQSVLQRIDEADGQFKNQGDFRRKYELMKAVATAGAGNYPEADTMLSRFISLNNNDTGLSNWAKMVLEYIRKQPMQPQVAPEQNNKIRDTGVTGLDYNYNAYGTHYMIIVGKQDQRFSGLKSGISDYNLMKPGNEAIIVSLSTLDQDRSLIVCKEFANAAATKKYMNEVKNVKLLFREFKPNEYELLLISADNFLRLFTKRDYSTYKAFYSQYYR